MTRPHSGETRLHGLSLCGGIGEKLGANTRGRARFACPIRGKLMKTTFLHGEFVRRNWEKAWPAHTCGRARFECPTREKLMETTYVYHVGLVRGVCAVELGKSLAGSHAWPRKVCVPDSGQVNGDDIRAPSRADAAGRGAAAASWSGGSGGKLRCHIASKITLTNAKDAFFTR